MSEVGDRLIELGNEIQLLWNNKKMNISKILHENNTIKQSNEIKVGGELATATIFTIIGALGGLVIQGIYYMVRLFLDNKKVLKTLQYDMANIINIITTKIKTVDDVLNYGAQIEQHIILYRYIANLLYNMKNKLNSIKEQEIESDTICICDSNCSSIIHNFKDNLKKAVEIKAMNSDILQFVVDVEK